MAKIRIPTPLRAYTDGEPTIEVAGETVGEALGNLVQQHPDLRMHLFQDDDLRSFVNIFIGDEDIRFMQGLDTEIASDDSLRIIPSIAGGNPPRSPQSIGGMSCGKSQGGRAWVLRARR